MTVYDPALYEDTSAKVNLAVRGAVLAPTFFQYAPCLLFSQPYGFGMFPYGVSIQPTGARLPLKRLACSNDSGLFASGLVHTHVAQAHVQRWHVQRWHRLEQLLIYTLVAQVYSSSQQAGTTFPRALMLRPR